LNWRPNDRLRITGEWLRIDSTRDQRLLESAAIEGRFHAQGLRTSGLAPRQIDRQVQVSARVYF
jgi:hypothetical protein